MSKIVTDQQVNGINLLRKSKVAAAQDVQLIIYIGQTEPQSPHRPPTPPIKTPTPSHPTLLATQPAPYPLLFKQSSDMIYAKQANSSKENNPPTATQLAPYPLPFKQSSDMTYAKQANSNKENTESPTPTTSHPTLPATLVSPLVVIFSTPHPTHPAPYTL